MPTRRRHTLIGLFSAVGVVLVAVFAWMNVPSLIALVDEVPGMNWWLLAVGVTLSTIAMLNRGLLNHAAHQAVGLAPRPDEMARVSAVGFSAQKVVKSGGLSGLAVFAHHARRRGYEIGAVTGACVLVAAASFVALGVLMSATLAALALSGRLEGWWILAGIGFSIYAVAVVTIGVVLGRSRTMAERMLWKAHRLIAQLRKRPAPTDQPRALDDLYRAMSVAREHPRHLARLVGHAVVGKCAGISMLMVAAHSVGLPIRPIDALIIYATTLGASLVSVVPGGFGVVEASTAALLIAGGAAATTAAIVVALFRAFDMWLPLVCGIVVARGQLRAQAAPPVVGHVGHVGPAVAMPAVA